MLLRRKLVKNMYQQFMLVKPVFQHLLYTKVLEMSHAFVSKNVRRLDLTDDRTVDANFGTDHY
jgi:hypothetical protein